jgi:hypothetical protein
MANQTHAGWSAFAHVTPDSEKKFNIEVSLIPMGGQKDNFLVRVKAVGYDHKLAWLIITSDKLSEKGQQLRSYIWESAKPEKDIILKKKLMPTGVGGFRTNSNDPKYYEVELDSDLIKHSYIYIDFPSMVFDGGYYYSIDLGEYLKHNQTSANKTLHSDG